MYMQGNKEERGTVSPRCDCVVRAVRGRHIQLTLEDGRMGGNGLPWWMKEEEGPQRQKE